MVDDMARHRLLTLLAVMTLAAFPFHTGAAGPQVRESVPAAAAIITGLHAEYVIRFDRPVDRAASNVVITAGGRTIQTLTPRLDSAVDVLFASGEAPPPGQYLLHWETRSPDGEPSRGDIPFSVAR